MQKTKKNNEIFKYTILDKKNFVTKKKWNSTKYVEDFRWNIRVSLNDFSKMYLKINTQQAVEVKVPLCANFIDNEKCLSNVRTFLDEKTLTQCFINKNT